MRRPAVPYDSSAVPLLAPALDEIVGRRVRDGHAPSSAYALVADGAVVATGGAGGEASPVPDGGTAFRIASCTKSFTATAMLQLRDSGLLDLDEPVDTFLPIAVTGGSAPTVAQLAGMVGGIPFDDPWADRQESMTTADFDAMTARGIRLVSEPGTRYEYSSLGYALLGRVLERVSGRRYIDLVREDVLHPLGLTGIAFDRSVEAPGGIAAGFARVGDQWVEQPWAEPGAFSPLGGLLATPAALGAWVAWLAAAWRPEGTPDGTAGAGAVGTAADSVLAAASRRELQTGRMPTGTAPGTRYGWGLVAEEDPRHGAIVSHSGGYPGFGAHMRWHAGSGIGVVVLENARYSGAIRAATAGLTAVLDSTRATGSAPVLWPETLAARAAVEELLRGRPDSVTRIASDNLELDEPLARRAAHAATIATRIELAPDAPVSAPDAADSESAAHLVWRVRGTRGSARCEVRLTPEASPRLQTLVIQLG
ncbi:serine hydrolase domain-containing protein [uncultured Amnibacterium sp.]|uniref:serine hydrolase domain-containing protein n=1 Tax=uncultured Amnibacterium sp. TaxID=1631851 RepID=UPI0035CAF412